jgi:hypothetical protein
MIHSIFMKISFFISLLVFSLQAPGQRTFQKDQMKLSLSGIFISGHTLSFDMLLFNRSLLGYEPQYIKFFVREKHIVRRTAVQYREILPLIPVKSLEIPPDSNQHIVLHFYAFTIPRTKELVIAVKEKNGARDLALHFSGHRLMKMIRLKSDVINPISIINKNQVYE